MSSISIRWFPPSWLLIKVRGKIIYIDPAWIQKNFDGYPGKVIFSRYPQAMDGLPELDLPRADMIFVSHHHQDHVKTATINRLATEKTTIYATAKCAELIGRKYHIIKPGDRVEKHGIAITAVHAYNTARGSSTRKVHRKGECVGFVVNYGDVSIYHAGDTDLIPEMGELGHITAAFLPIGGTFTMNPQEACDAVMLIKPSIAVPMHYGNSDPAEFRNLTEGKTGCRVMLMKTGQALEL